MTLHFYLRFHSKTGQNFFITGNIPQLGDSDITKVLPIHYLNSDFWYGSVEVDETVPPIVKYNYILRGEDGNDVAEPQHERTIDLRLFKKDGLRLYDTWNYMGGFQNAFYTQPFQQILLKKAANTKQETTAITEHTTHVFKIKYPLLQQHETLFIAGSGSQLGNWTNPQLLTPDGEWFTAGFNLADSEFPITYKYGIWNNVQHKIVRFEDGTGRMILEKNLENQTVILQDGFAQLPDNSFRGAGVAIPVFSLRTQNSFGVGEFADIKQLVNWSKQIGLKLIQLLPLNDTTANNTWTDSYPYAAISAFALHPMFINLAAVAGTEHAHMLEPFTEKQQTLNALPAVDYTAVMAAKRTALAALYDVMKAAWQTDAGYLAFYQPNKHWLLPYAVFCSLRDENKTVEFNTWKKHSVYKQADIEKLGAVKSKGFDKVGIHLFIQYHLHLQLLEAVAYAHENGVVMKGDIPIGVYRNSCDAWENPALFNMDAQAGAPPDDFAVKGQNWGFPTYNWQKMQEDGFGWWKQRFSQMSHYFDAFRIDHILGFFRIWSIPMDAVQGILGHFVPAIPVYAVEFKQKSIWFDKDRYCKPFINEMVLRELFGHKADWVKKTFIDNVGFEPFHLKTEFNTQRKIETWFNVQTNIEPWIKESLFNLLSNVILFEEEGSDGTQFHFRIDMESTLSFRYLDNNTQQQLKELYINYYFRRQDEFWKQQALLKLPALKAATNMLICGEDLGMVPDCVPGVMKDLGLLSLEIQRMPKDPAKKFFHPADAPYLSVVTPSTHDMSTIRGWWEEDRTATQQFFNRELGQAGAAPYFCEPWVNRQIVIQHLHSPAMWSIFQLQDLMGIDGDIRRENPADERINVPADPSHYWRYRMHISLEDLQHQSRFNDELRSLVKGSGR